MPLSLRDPAGRLRIEAGRVLRSVFDPAAGDTVKTVLASPLLKKAVDEGRLVRSWVVEDGDPLVLEHERVAFPSFPYEWSAGMLGEAGRVTLALARTGLKEGLGLKDATPFNVLFRGPRAVFVDILSFERRDPGDATWLPYAQFVRTFLSPLACRRLGLGLDRVFLAQREGLEPEEVYRLAGPLRRLVPPFLSLATVPTLLGRMARSREEELYTPRRLANPERARFVVESLLRGLQKRLDRLSGEEKVRSSWSNYDSACHYSAADAERKRAFVAEVIAACRPRRVLDVGANTGRFSEMAARAGADVVAIDSDPVVVERLWRRAAAEGLGILPLVVDLARPSPAVGWRNGENESFLERASGAFDLVLMLAVIHHLLVSERIPLDEVADVVAGLGAPDVVVEWVEPSDRQFRRIARGRDGLFVATTREAFGRSFGRHFDVVREVALADAPRHLVHLRRRPE